MSDVAFMSTFAHVESVYKGSDGEATKALYAQIMARGDMGRIAVNLMRACKTSERAKLYRGGVRGRGSYRAMAYEKKDWALGELVKALASIVHDMKWGWGIDEDLKRQGTPHHHVLYVDIPVGQVSFHTGQRGQGPNYHGCWDGVRGTSSVRICKWASEILEATS